MDMLRKPKVLFFARIAQLIFAIAFLILVSWCGTHRGYWIYNVTAAIAIGVIATLLTFVITGHGIWIYSRKNPFAGHGKVYTYSRLALEILMILIWIGTASLSLRNKGEDFSQVLNLPPFVQWDICIAFTFVEIISFILTTVLVFVEDHTSGMKIRNTTSASYV
ncbi:hypothetical protein MMC19_003597 [Ptychographa xylographoides]|nr:hypothetical protein [Ptychographa xylographoides]